LIIQDNTYIVDKSNEKFNSDFSDVEKKIKIIGKNNPTKVPKKKLSNLKNII